MTALDLQPSSLWVILWQTRCYPCYPKQPAVAHQGEAAAGDSPEAFTPGQVHTALAGAANGARG